MVDVGPDTGALVVYTSASHDGEEIEIRPHGGVWTGTHTAVRPRHLGARVLHAGVFGCLRAGSYDLRIRPGHTHRHHEPPAVTQSPPRGPVTTVAVGAGAVSETTLGGTDRAG